MKQLTLYFKNNRILRLCNLKQLSILYYRAYGLYGLYYWDDNASEKLICSSDDFSRLMNLEKKIEEYYKDGKSELRI